MITVLGVLVVVGVLVVARYGSPRPDGPAPADVRLLAALAPTVAALARRVAAHRAAWAAYEEACRPYLRDSRIPDTRR